MVFMQIYIILNLKKLRNKKVEYFVAYEKEHFENISTKHKDKMQNQNQNIINGRKFNVKWALPLKDFEIEVNKENKVYDDL